MKVYWEGSLSDCVVLDVETTGTSNEAKITQLAAVLYINGEEVDNFVSYVNPHQPIPFIVQEKTGITDEMVAEAPDVEAVLPSYLAFLRQAPVVTGYNVRFDLRFLSNASGEDLTESLDWFDALPIAKLYIPDLPHYRLCDVCDVVGYDTAFHDALNDCRACAAVLIAIEEGSSPFVQEPMPSTRMVWRHRGTERTERPLPNIQVTADGALAGKNVVLTGELTFSRDHAIELIKAAGGKVTGSVSRRTSYLVVGERVATMGPSGKEKKAAELIAAGQDIKIIHEADFVRLLEGKELETDGAAFV